MSPHPVGTMNLHPNPGPAVVVAASQNLELRRRSRLCVILFLIAGLVAALSVTASGQGFASMKMHPSLSDPATIKKMETEARNYAGTGPAAKTYAKVYYETYVPGKITQPDSLGEIDDLIKNITLLLSRAERSNNPRAAEIRDWIFNGMKRVAEGNYHPPARINALLVLGRLDQAPANQVTQTPPVPLRRSLPILMGQYKNEANVDGVRAAALQGLHRYVSYGLATLAANEKAAIATTMSELLASDPPPGRSERAHAYLQRYAVDVLDLLRAQGDSTLGVQLVSISTEPKKPDLIALHSAARLGRMNDEMKGKLAAPKDVLSSWSARALSVFESELARLKALERPAKAKTQPSPPDVFLDNKRAVAQAGGADDTAMDGMMGMMEDSEIDMEMGGESEFDDMAMMMQMGMGSGTMGAVAIEAKPQPPEVLASRRKINHALEMIHLGVTGSPVAGLPSTPGGVLGMVSDEQKPEVEDWILAMQPIVEAINDSTLDDRKKYVEGLTAQIEALRVLAGEAKQQAVEAEPVFDPLAAPANPLAGPAPAKAAPAAAPAPPVVDELAAP